MSSPVLCYITARSQLKSVPLAEVIRETLRAGVDMVQIREKDLPTRELMALVEVAVRAARELPAEAQASRPRTRGHSFAPHSRESRHSREGGNPSCSGTTIDPRVRGGDDIFDFRSIAWVTDPCQLRTGSDRACVLVNDRLDVALAARAGGVHLGGNSMPTAEVRKVAPRPFVVGVSCHSLAEAIAAESAGADYLLLGPVYETPSKLKYGPPLGLDELRRVTARIRIPVLALGGITVERVRPCFEAGASGIAGIRIFQDCESVETLVRELRAQGE